jgi:hypothetical protein
MAGTPLLMTSSINLRMRPMSSTKVKTTKARRVGTPISLAI